MDNIELQVLRKELQKQIDTTMICWVCGRENLLTKHHSIPQKVLSPLLNLEIPICENCTKVVHSGDETAVILRKIYLKEGR